MIFNSVRNFHPVRDEVDVAEQKFSPLKSMLPEFGPVVYVTGNPNFQVNILKDPVATKEFFLAQYVLCPRILLLSAEPEFVVINSGQMPRVIKNK